MLLSRRDFLKLSSMTVGAALAHQKLSDVAARFAGSVRAKSADAAIVEGYASATSVEQGNTISFHASSLTTSSLRLEIARLGLEDVTVLTTLVVVLMLAVAGRPFTP